MKIPVICITGYSGSGKTTVLEQLISKLGAQGLNIAVIKHAHHNFEIDHPGKDSYRLRKSGAQQVAVISNQRLAFIHEFSDKAYEEPPLQLALKQIGHCDLIFAEGFKHEDGIKIEINRKANNKAFLFPDDDQIIALISDHLPARLPKNIKHIPLGDIDALATFINERFIKT